MKHKLTSIFVSIAVVLLLLILTLMYTEITGITSLVTGSAVATVASLPGTDNIMFRLQAVPNIPASPPMNAAPWDHPYYSAAVSNPSSVFGKTAEDIHTCDVSPNNQIGKVNPNGGFFYPTGSTYNPPGPTDPVCYSHF